jgi:hypothetical protein
LVNIVLNNFLLITSQWRSSSSTAIIKEVGFGGVGARRKNPSPLEKAATKIRAENARGLDFAFCLFFYLQIPPKFISAL